MTLYIQREVLCIKESIFMTGGINAKLINSAADLQKLQQQQAEGGDGNTGQVQTSSSEGSKSIWNIYSEHDANQNEILTKDEHTKLSGWKPNKSNSEILNGIIKGLLDGNNDMSSELKTKIQNNVFTALSAKILGSLAKASTDILNNFQGLKVGSKQVEITSKPGSDASISDVSGNEEAIKIQAQLNALEQQGVEEVLNKFESDFEGNITDTINNARQSAETLINLEIKANAKGEMETDDSYGKSKKREVDGKSTDVYKKDGKHYIKNDNDQYEEVFLVNDRGKKKYVTQETKAKLGLDSEEAGDIKTQKVTVNGEEKSLIQSGEQSGHKVYSDSDGNQYIKDGGQYFSMTSPEGMALAQGGSARVNRETGKVEIKYGNKTYESGSEELKEETSNLQSRYEERDFRSAELNRGEPGRTTYEAGDLVETKVRNQISDAQATLIKENFPNNDDLTQEETTKLNEALEADIKATMGNGENNFAITTSNIDNAIKDIKADRAKKAAEEEAKKQPTLGDGGADKVSIKNAGTAIHKWGGRANRPELNTMLKGEDGNITAQTADDAIKTILKDMGFDQSEIKDYESFKKSIINANPSVFNGDGKVYSNANWGKFDFPSQNAIQSKFMETSTPAPKPAGESGGVKKAKSGTADNATQMTEAKAEKMVQNTGIYEVLANSDIEQGRLETALKADIEETIKTNKLCTKNLNELAATIRKEEKEKAASIDTSIAPFDNTARSDNTRVARPFVQEPIKRVMPTEQEKKQIVALTDDYGGQSYSGTITRQGQNIKVTIKIPVSPKNNNLAMEEFKKYVKNLGFDEPEKLRITCKNQPYWAQG